MRKFLTLFLAVIAIISITVVLQQRPEGKIKKFSKKNGYTSEELIADQVQKKIERRKQGYAKQDKPDKFLEYIHLLKTGGEPDNNYLFNQALLELKKARKVNGLKASVSLDWKERGPGNVGGRTRGFIADPDDATGNTWFVGPVGGGVWKTTDTGTNWTSLTPEWPNLAVSCLAMAQSNTSVIYAGTGEGFGNLDAIKGNGIFKSTDKGENWVQLGSTIGDSNFEYVNRMIVNPDDENEVVVVTNTGIFKTLDGGATWKEKYSLGASKIQDIRCLSGDFNKQFAAVNGKGIISSIDGGENWLMAKEISEGRIELCLSTVDSDYMYALTSQSNLYISTDGGDNWLESTPEEKVVFLSGQGWYNNTMVAHPSIKSQLFVGGLDLHKVVVGAKVSGQGTDVYDIIDGTSEIFTFLNIEGQYLGGGVNVDFAKTDLFRDVKIQFGTGNSQKAHRFTDSAGEVANPSSSSYTYKDYVDVPFVVTDNETGEQLMVSFRDHDNNGEYNLTENSYEQIYVHSLAYNAGAADSEIGIDGGVDTKRIISVNPAMANGLIWDVNAIPNVSIVLDKYELKSRSISSEQLTVWYENTSSPTYAHADHHNLHVIESAGQPFRIVNCNDGGIAMSDDGGVNWSSPINGYVTTQFYGVSKHPDIEVYIGGTQDNGTWLSPEGSSKLGAWSRALGGDGFETAWNNNSPEKIAISLYYNDIRISHNGGENWFSAGIPDMGEDNSPFVTRIANEMSAPDMLLVGAKSGIWVSYDFGINWSSTPMPSGTWPAGDYNPHIAVSPVDSRYIWAGNAMSANYDIAVSSNGGKSYSSGNKADNAGAYISDIIAHPTEERSAFVLFAANNHSKILYSNDLGDSWTDLTQFNNGESQNGFPNVAVYSLAVMPFNTDIIWAGTEIGIFESTDKGATWHFADNGLPAVSIWDMKFVGKQLVVGTHGLGVWTLDFNEIVETIKPPVITSASKSPLGYFDYKVDLYRDYDKVELYIDEQLQATYEDVSAGEFRMQVEVQSFKSQLSTQVYAYVGAEVKKSNYLWMSNPQFEDAVEKYMNSFASRRNDFSGEDFVISDMLFNDAAIHSTHPYVENKESYYVLNYPIKVLNDREDAILSYRDIALVEPGEVGTKFGDPEFWDYVVVEGTVNGSTWVPLADGYDVNKYDKWKDFADSANEYSNISSQPNSEDLFVEHTINLHDKFEPGDVILIRFRMHSDANSVGWGWVIDDLIIQETGTSISPIRGDDNDVFKVGPNPATSFVDLTLESDERGEVSVVVYDMAGRAIVVRDFYKNSTNWTQQLQLGDLPKGMKIVTMSINGKTYKQKLLIK
ncbi:T9SS type A sorting domain-containing protein [Carboxylicivirga sediminis]|uniref:T9SS type A sorting domain-containing protein n=1 Tax=Carboxylicivirga sediminis TaxID=2006564 RepID=A0A941F5G4_9BACT|nr:T9SS type A sorting domain-containing protein [Carboxylicivirga sediminis]MBR8537198.1 T9SS type A sorting domain-containing protein [Carboxylicivirga sediminis]